MERVGSWRLSGAVIVADEFASPDQNCHTDSYAPNVYGIKMALRFGRNGAIRPYLVKSIATVNFPASLLPEVGSAQ